ncbi:MAG TPA: PAS domain-containing protein, partial [Candidatus Polarisedimenticolaceae bacterium]|nr:PAS domain-containing protein [Candidatus Polarisedimenticolaceae bacterium]
MDHGSPTGHPDPEGELRLERRVAELEQLLDNVDGIVWTGDPGGLRFRYVSRRAERLLGYPVEQWIEEPQFWLNHMHPDDREWVPSLAYSQSRVGQAHEFEFRMIAADGRTIWLRNVVTVAKQEEGGPVLRGLMIDISARKESERRTERRNAALHELARSEALDSGDFDLFTRLAIQTAADVLDVDRIGVWLFNDDRSILRCESLYERGKDRFSTGLELQAAAYPRYFAALADGRFVAADDALTDPTTSEFAESYLAPLGITSMLDAPIRRGQKLIGVVCHEHVGPARRWLHDEREFAASIAHFVSHALEARHRSRAEQDVRRGQQRLLEQKLLEKERVERELARTREHLVRQTRLSTIGQIAASIAHELRNPLGAIRNATFYLRRHVPREDPKWVKHVGIIEQEV